MTGRALLVCILFATTLSSCIPARPERYPTELPAGPVVLALQRQRADFPGLTALARVEISRHGAHRTFDSAGIVVDRQGRLRFEAYGPLGQSVLAFVWDGRNALIRRQGGGLERAGKEGLERLFGRSIRPPDLCAVLSATLPEADSWSAATFRCGPERRCLLQLRQGNELRKAVLAYPDGGSAPDLLSLELTVSNKIIYRAVFDSYVDLKTRRFPKRIELEFPDSAAVVAYEDVDLKAPADPDVFFLGD